MTAPVSFGRFVLDPADARLLGPAGPVHLGRKAFCVLEALVAQPGRLLTKEALFETVWDGTTVSESALTSVIRELRRALGDDIKTPRFIQSVYGRGYRFVAPVTPSENPTPLDHASPGADILSPVARLKPSRGVSRRKVLGWSAVAVAATAATTAAWKGSRTPQIKLTTDVSRLITHARQLMDQNSTDGQYEAMGLLRRVTDVAPRFADGWGLLAMAYAIPSHYRPRAEGLALRERARAAGRRALVIDPGNGYGELALGLELPIIGHWTERDERFARALANRPDNDDVLTFIAVILQFNGRASAAIPYYQRIRQRPLTPAAYSNYVRALWSAGRIEETGRALNDAAALYPTQASLWSDRFQIQLFSGHSVAAMALAREPSGRPPALDADGVADLVAQAAAVREPRSREARRTLDGKVRDAGRSASDAQVAIRLAGALGAVDAAFHVADAYYFSRGFAVPDYPQPGNAASLDQRQTRLLFEPETASMRADPRFETLVSDIGLTDYWRTSGVEPDYRRRERPRA